MCPLEKQPPISSPKGMAVDRIQSVAWALSPSNNPTKPSMTYTETRVSGHQRQTQYKTVWVQEHTRSTASERAHRPFTGAGHVDMESIRARRTYIAQRKAAGLPY